MTIGEVLVKLKQAELDTEYSKAIFEIEEGSEDSALKHGRRDWILISEIYGSDHCSQRFHLDNYLKFKLHNGLKESDQFETKCYRYIRNVALILYIREVIFDERKEDLELLVYKAKEQYSNDANKINNVSFASEMRK